MSLWNILRLQSGPQVMPYSNGLLVVLLLLHLLVDIVLAGRNALAWNHLAAAGANTLFSATFVFALLHWANKAPRFVQTLSALLAVEIVLGVLAGGLLLVYPLPGFASLVTLLWLLLMAWNVAVAAHIFRHALDKNLIWGLGLGLVYFFLAWQVVTMVLGPEVGGGSP
ncbi:MAG: hypothetical protein R6X06_03270 [Gammaproteobacteria bacterium]